MSIVEIKCKNKNIKILNILLKAVKCKHKISIVFFIFFDII